MATLIPGATSPTYTTASADVGSALTVSVVASNSGGSSAPATSAQTAAVFAAVVPVNTALPTISGTPTVGTALTSTNGTWSNTPTSFARQWNRAGTPIGGATGTTYTPVTADLGSVLSLTVIATNGSGSSAPATSANTTAVVPAGGAQYPNLLDMYGAHRPPWSVAGVDFYVGLPPGTTLTDWRTLPTSGTPVSVNLSNGQIYMSGDFVFDGYDFTTGVGAWIFVPGGGANNITFTNCKFGFSIADTQLRFIDDRNDTTGTIRHCTFDGTNAAYDSLVNGFATLTVEYNYFKNARAHILQMANFQGSATGSLTYRYNFIDDMNIGCGTHQNYLQWSNNNQTVTFNVSFNTTIQRSLGGSEGFQFYQNGIGVVFPTPSFTNNTMIARPATPTRLCIGTPYDNVYGPQVMSYMVHGSIPDENTGTGLNNNNYFDKSGAFGAYAPGTMPGWSSSGNVDMSTGATITPS